MIMRVVPVVLLIASEPVESGLAERLAHPGPRTERDRKQGAVDKVQNMVEIRGSDADSFSLFGEKQ